MTIDIKTLQDEINTRWSNQDNPCSGSDANHALTHMMKALGKIASALNDAEHENRDLKSDEIGKYLADLVICAARLSHDVIDLDAAVISRFAEKFPIK